MPVLLIFIVCDHVFVDTHHKAQVFLVFSACDWLSSVATTYESGREVLREVVPSQGLFTYMQI